MKSIWVEYTPSAGKWIGGDGTHREEYKLSVTLAPVKRNGEQLID